MRERISKNAGLAALAISMLGLVLSMSGWAVAAHLSTIKPKSKSKSKLTKLAGHPVSTKAYAGGILLLSSHKKFPASAIPTVKNASELAGKTLLNLTPSCAPTTVDLGTWCLEASPYPIPNQDQGMNNYLWASQACVRAGGWLPSAAQLIGAAPRVRLESTIHDSPETAAVDQDPTNGLKDQREMSSTLVTTAAGSAAAGSEGVSAGSLGDPRTGEPNPIAAPAVPRPATLQYVTVYSDETKGGFAGSEPVSQAENFRCAYAKAPGVAQQSEE
jgi:hypothetical protein